MQQPLTICTFKWGDKYTIDHVRRLYNMLSRNLTIPWRFALITDRAGMDWRAWGGVSAGIYGEAEHGGDIPIGVRIIPLWQEMRDAKLCGVRIRAFGEDMYRVIGPRFAWIDLDVVITGNVDHIFGRVDEFVALKTAGPPLPYNGSMVMMNAGARAHVLERWTAEEYSCMKDYWMLKGIKAGGQSDEGWMGYILGDHEPTITQDDGVYYFRRDLQSGFTPLPENTRLVVMNGRAYDPSSKTLQRRCPWIEEHWR